MKINFHKYQATGNDFILIDNRNANISFTIDQIKKICDRKFGVGADGLILIEKHPSISFSLVYYNSDGTQSLCGNGSRAATHFASFLGMIEKEATFHAFDGTHDAALISDDIVRLRMSDVSEVKRIHHDYFINTGSPHYIRFVDKVVEYPVVEEGRKIRYSKAFASTGGTNVNFIELLPENRIFVRTYERGVEDETLSCGTGVTAAALAASLKSYQSPVTIQTLGGELSVEFEKNKTGSPFTGIYLIGPAKMVFEGSLEL